MMQYALHYMLLRMAFASIREGLRLVANPNDDFPAEYLEKAKKKEQQPLPQPLAGQPQPDFLVQQQQQQRRKQDFVFYEWIILTSFCKGTFLAEGIDVFVISPNRRTFYFPELLNLNFGDF